MGVLFEEGAYGYYISGRHTGEGRMHGVLGEDCFQAIERVVGIFRERAAGMKCLGASDGGAEQDGDDKTQANVRRHRHFAPAAVADICCACWR